MDKEAASEAGKRHRSPNYPSFNLETALDKVRLYYKEERRNPASLKVAAAHWDLKETSSSLLKAIAALKSYGLIDEIGQGKTKKIILSDLALKIILDERQISADRDKAIQKAAQSPKIYKKLIETFYPDFPSKENLKHHLIFEENFNEDKVEGFIKKFYETLEFAKIFENDTLKEDDLEESEFEKEPEEAKTQTKEVQQQDSENLNTSHQSDKNVKIKGIPIGSSIPISKECWVTIVAEGNVTQKGLDQLVAYINLIKASFPEVEE